MTLEIKKQRYIFKSKEIWFSDYPYDVDGCHGVTFCGCRNKVDREGFEREDGTTLVIDLTQDLDAIWGNMSKKSCRYEIKRAVREGICIELNHDYSQFYELNRAFRRKKGLSIGSEKLSTMRRYGTLFTAKLEGEIVAGQLYLEDNDHIRWLYGASKRLEVARQKATLIGCANRLIIWEAIKYAKEKGVKEFDMGGIYTGEDRNDPRYTIKFFKQSFGGEIFKDYFYTKYYSEVYQLANRIYQLVGGNR